MKKLLLITTALITLSTSVMAQDATAVSNVSSSQSTQSGNTTVTTLSDPSARQGQAAYLTNAPVSNGSDLSSAVGIAAAPALTTTLTETLA